MKTLIAIIALVMFAALAFVALKSWLVTKRKFKTWKDLTESQRDFFKSVHRTELKAFANVGEGTHEVAKTYLSDAAFSTRFLLFKQGTDSSHVDLCGVSDVPIGTVANEASAAEEGVAVQLLGKGPTKKMVASGAISAHALVYVGALGKVASSGTQIVGISLTASTTDGDVIEVDDGMPLSATPGIAASTIDANTVLYGVTDNTPAALAMAASTTVARLASGNIVAATVTEMLTMLGGNSAPTGTGKVVLQTSPTLVTPVLGVATGTSLAASGLITSSSPSAGIGYATGAGSTVSQATDRTTGVTINAVSGAITTQATSLAAAAEVSFTVTNSAVAIGDVILACIRSGPTATTNTFVTVTAVASGSFVLTLNNPHASTADTGAAIINFMVLKAVSA